MHTPSRAEPAHEPEGQFAVVDGVRIHYHRMGRIGAGEPLLMIHGAGPGAGGWSNFHRNVGALSERYEVIIIDLPGFNRSDKLRPSGGLFAFHTRYVLGFMDALGLDKAHLIGNSLGGAIALRIALDRPARVERLVLMGPAGLQPQTTPMPTEGIRHLLDYYASGGPSREKLKAFLNVMIYDPSQLTADLFEQRYRASTDPQIVANPPVDWSAVIEPLWRENLRAIEQPTLILWGREDRVNPLDGVHILLSQLPNAQLTVFTRCGHWVQWEKTAAFNTTVLAFLGSAGP